MPMLRKVSLDLCDAKDGDFDIPEVSYKTYLMILVRMKSTLKIYFRVSAPLKV